MTSAQVQLPGKNIQETIIAMGQDRLWSLWPQQESDFADSRRHGPREVWLNDPEQTLEMEN